MWMARYGPPRPARGSCRPHRTKSLPSASRGSRDGDMKSMESKLPMPSPNGDSLPYWNAAREQRLLIRSCKACGAKHFMPRYLCPECWSDDLEWVESSGRGRVHSFSVVHRAPTPVHMANAPYVIALVDLDEGPRM